MKEYEIEDKRHLRSLVTRQKILEASKYIFLQEGFQKTTISQVIKRAKVGYGTAYVHFNGKEALLSVLMEEVMTQFYEIAEMPFFPKTKQEAKEIIEKQAYRFLKMAETERGIMRVFQEAMGMSDVIAHQWKDIRKQFIEGISKDILYVQEHHLARGDVKAHIVAKGWFFMNEMYLWEIVQNEHHGSVEEISQTISSLYVDGLYSEKEEKK
ncbi:TetR/AcrR family transcriptional regulator [Bacillus sp. JZ8]